MSFEQRLTFLSLCGIIYVALPDVFENVKGVSSMQLYVCSSCGSKQFYVCFTSFEVRLLCVSCFQLNVVPLSSLIEDEEARRVFCEKLNLSSV